MLSTRKLERMMYYVSIEQRTVRALVTLTRPNNGTRAIGWPCGIPYIRPPPLLLSIFYRHASSRPLEG